MRVSSENFKVDEIKETGFEKVPRAFLSSKEAKVALDFHADLCALHPGDTVKLEMFLDERPSIGKSTYLTRGVIYKVEEGKESSEGGQAVSQAVSQSFEASFGGLLMFYKGPAVPVGLEGSLYVSVSKY